MSDEKGYLADAISRQSVESDTWILLMAYSKRRKKRNHLKMELFIKREVEFKDLENFQLIQFVKNEKACYHLLQ